MKRPRIGTRTIAATGLTGLALLAACATVPIKPAEEKSPCVSYTKRFVYGTTALTLSRITLCDRDGNREVDEVLLYGALVHPEMQWCSYRKTEKEYECTLSSAKWNAAQGLFDLLQKSDIQEATRTIGVRAP